MVVTTGQACRRHDPMSQIPKNWDICVRGLISLETRECIVELGTQKWEGAWGWRVDALRGK